MTLRVTQLSCRRGGQLVLAGLDLTVERGRALLVRGPNGAGKTTLLRVLAGLTKLAEGDVRLGDTSLLEAPDDWSAQVAYAGHLDAVKPQLTLAQNLQFWARLHGIGDVASALAHFGLTHLADRPAQMCSAGQKRRAGLARLLLAPRLLWLLDEPATALDQAAIRDLERALDSHAANGGIAVIATHQPLRLAYADSYNLVPLAQNSDPFLTGAA